MYVLASVYKPIAVPCCGYDAKGRRFSKFAVVGELEGETSSLCRFNAGLFTFPRECVRGI